MALTDSVNSIDGLLLGLGRFGGRLSSWEEIGGCKYVCEPAVAGYPGVLSFDDTGVDQKILKFIGAIIDLKEERCRNLLRMACNLTSNISDAALCSLYAPMTSESVESLDSFYRDFPPFERIYFFDDQVSGEDVDRLRYLVAAQRVPEIAALLAAGWRGSARYAEAWPLYIGDDIKARCRTGAIVDCSLVQGAMDAFEWIVEDLGCELERLGRSAYSVESSDLWIPWGRLEDLRGALEDALSEAARGELFFSALARLPRLPQAEALLGVFIETEWERFREGHESSDLLGQVELLILGREIQLSALAPVFLKLRDADLAQYYQLPRGQGNDAQESLWVRVLSALKFWKSDLPVRDALRHLAQVLRNAINRPEVRSRLLALFFRCVLERRKGAIGSSTPLPGKNIREEVRKSLGFLNRERTILALPRKVLSTKEMLDIVGWVEAIHRGPCEIVEIEGTDGWLYSEGGLEGRESATLYRDGCHFSIEEPSSAVPISQGVSSSSAGESSPPGSELGEPPAGLRLEAEPSEEKLSCICGFGLASPRAQALGEFPPKTCHKCGGYNHRYWWQCCHHGKAPVDVSVADDRCPECILRHHSDPADYPLSSISMRPDLLNIVYCPHCSDLHSCNPRHQPYCIPFEILPFYRNGVTASEVECFRKLAGRHGLSDDFRCPICRTLLIPVHHRGGGTCEAPRGNGHAAH